MPKYIKKGKPSWENLKYFKPWSSIGEKIRDKFTRKNSAEIHEIADENHTDHTISVSASLTYGAVTFFLSTFPGNHYELNIGKVSLYNICENKKIFPFRFR
jgi:hypothetical protein